MATSATQPSAPTSWEQLMSYAPTAVDQQENIPGAPQTVTKDVPGFGATRFSITPSGQYSTVFSPDAAAPKGYVGLTKGTEGDISRYYSRPDTIGDWLQVAYPVLMAYGAYLSGPAAGSSAVSGGSAGESALAGGASTTPGTLATTAGTGANVLTNAGVTGLIPEGGAMSTTPALLQAGSTPNWLSGAQSALAGSYGAEDFTGLGGSGGSGLPQTTSLASSGIGSSISNFFSNPIQSLSGLFSGGGSTAGFGSLSNIMNVGSGIYGMYQSQKLKELAAKMSAGADTWGTTGGRNLASTQLQALMQDPSSITKMPGYDAGIQAVERRMASQGYTGSGNAMIALQKYGGDFYNNAIAQLSQLAGVGFNPASAASLGVSGATDAASIGQQSLNSAAYGISGGAGSEAALLKAYLQGTH